MEKFAAIDFETAQLAADQCLFGGDRRDEPGGDRRPVLQSDSSCTEFLFPA